MKKVLLSGLLLLAVTAFFAFRPAVETEPAAADEIKWYTWEEAIQLAEDQPKKLFIDMYTDWCGWCKRMDATTFKDPGVVKHLNDNFYPVKFDAEQKEEVEYKGHTFKFIASGRRGVHELAYSLLDGKLGYPSYVYLDEEQRRITISPGYKPADKMLKELQFITGEHYKNGTFEEFMSGK